MDELNGGSHVEWIRVVIPFQCTMATASKPTHPNGHSAPAHATSRAREQRVARRNIGTKTSSFGVPGPKIPDCIDFFANAKQAQMLTSSGAKRSSWTDVPDIQNLSEGRLSNPTRTVGRTGGPKRGKHSGTFNLSIPTG